MSVGIWWKIAFFTAFLSVFFLVVWLDLEPATKKLVVDWIELHQSILISLGTIFLIAFLALLTTHLSLGAAKQRETSNRNVLAELKVAEFRQDWINELRDDLARYGELALRPENVQEGCEILALRGKVMMRLNFDERLACELHDAMAFESISDEGPIKVSMEEYTKFALAANIFLRAEWRRLKRDIKKAQLLEGEEML